MDIKVLLAEHQVFETERLILRKVEITDAKEMYEYASDEETAHYVSFVAHDSLERTKEGISTFFMENRLNSWGIVEKSSGKFIGVIDLRINGDQGTFGWIINKKYWGCGMVAEAAECLMQFGFEVLKLNVINAQHYTINPNSGRVMQKIGMKKLGQIWIYVRKEEKSILANYWAITKDEYKAR